MEDVRGAETLIFMKCSPHFILSNRSGSDPVWRVLSPVADGGSQRHWGLECREALAFPTVCETAGIRKGMAGAHADCPEADAQLHPFYLNGGRQTASR